MMRKPIVFALALVPLFVFAFFGAATSTPDGVESARLNNIGVAYMNQQLFEKALKSFDEAAAKDPNLKLAALNRGVALLNLQRPADARVLLETATKDSPKDPYAWFNLGLYYKNSSETDKAIEAFRHVTDIDPNDADSWYFLGSSYAQAKQLPEAIEAFNHALKLDPLHASATFGLARAFQQSGQADQAREHLKKFQYITQHKLGAPISLAYGEQGKYSRAEESPLAPQKVPPQIPVKFVDVTKEAGIAFKPSPLSTTYLGSGACFLDYDGHGNIDILLLDNGAQGAISLYHNLGDGKFEDVSRVALRNIANAHGIGCAIGDYDNDGFEDIALTTNWGVRLLHNEKNGTFKDVIGAGGIGQSTAGKKEKKPASESSESELPTLPPSSPPDMLKPPEQPIGVTFLDYDHDGDLDLYIAQSTLRRSKSEEEVWSEKIPVPANNMLWRNNGNGTFTDVAADVGVLGSSASIAAIGTDFDNDRAVDIVLAGGEHGAIIFENPREGKFKTPDVWIEGNLGNATGVAALDYNHDGWMDLAFTHDTEPGMSLWRNEQGKALERVPLPRINWARAYGVVAFDYDNDGWVDLAAVGETKDGKGEVRLFRNLGPDGWMDITAEVGLDKIKLTQPRAIIAGDYDNDGAVDLLITQNHGPAVLLRNEGGNKNNWLRLALKGLNDNKSAIGTKVEVFSDGIRQKFEVYGSSGYLGQNSPYLTIGLGQAKEADIVRMLWPTGVLQDEIQLAANKVQNLLEIDRRGSSCPTLFAWNGHEYKFVADMLGAGVVGHWVGPPQGLKPQSLEAANGTAKAVPFPTSRVESYSDQGIGERNIPRPVEYVKLDRDALKLNESPHPVAQNATTAGHPLRSDANHPTLSFRFMEPLEESVYLDSVGLIAVDHPTDVDVYPNEYFASNPPYPPFKVVFSNNKEARPPAGAWDEHGHDVLPDLLAHRYFGDFKVLSFAGFTEPHTLTLDLGEAYRGGPLWLLMHGEIEYFTANSMYAADQAHLQPFAPYVEAEESEGKWVRVVDDLGFPAGGARTMTADLTGKLPVGTRRIRFTTNLQIYWDNILISRTDQKQNARVSEVPLARADLSFHGFPLKIEGSPPGNVQYIYEQASATGPYTRPAGAYTRYGDVLPLLKAVDDKFAVFGSGDEVALDFDPAGLPALPAGWVRDYFFVAKGYEKDMDFYAYQGDRVAPLPFREMGAYPYPGKSFPDDLEHLKYLLEYNTRFMSGNEAKGYAFRYPDQR